MNTNDLLEKARGENVKLCKDCGNTVNHCDCLLYNQDLQMEEPYHEKELPNIEPINYEPSISVDDLPF